MPAPNSEPGLAATFRQKGEAICSMRMRPSWPASTLLANRISFRVGSGSGSASPAIRAQVIKPFSTEADTVISGRRPCPCSLTATIDLGAASYRTAACFPSGSAAVPHDVVVEVRDVVVRFERATASTGRCKATSQHKFSSPAGNTLASVRPLPSRFDPASIAASAAPPK